MRIECPHCGERGLEEFTHLGDATVRRPAYGAPATDWAGYVYLRDNPAGVHDEYWFHGGGCQAWLVVTRDTRDHRIAAVRAAHGGTA
jgi:sarcosine oxidase subunit delta